MNKQENDNQTIIEDLPVTDEQADRATGGGTPTGRTYVGTNVGVF